MNAIFRSLAMGCLLILTPAIAVSEGRVTVFAAASLRDVLEDAVEQWDQEAVISYGGSGVIARQVAQGAPADLVILANVTWTDWLETQEVRILSRQNVTANRLVLIGPAGAAPVREILPRLGDGRLAIGHTRGVPAGIYARQWLEHEGLWHELQARLAETENVRAALALVSRGEAPLGVVYASDAQADVGVDAVFDIPSETHDEIVYPMLVLSTKNRSQASEFASFMLSEAGQDLFVKHGFARLEAKP